MMAKRARLSDESMEGAGPSHGRGTPTVCPMDTIPPKFKTAAEGVTLIGLVSNHFRLIKPEAATIHTYRVYFVPPVESIRMRRKLIYEKRELFNNAYKFYDGNEIKSVRRLESEVTTVTGVLVSDDQQTVMTIRHISMVSWEHPENIFLYNTQMKKNLQIIGMTKIGHHYYDMTNRKVLNNWRLQIWPGIVTTIDEHEGGILMVSDIIYKVVRSQTAYHVLRESSMVANYRDVARKKLVDKVVMAAYNNKPYRVDDIIFDKNPTSYTFSRRGIDCNLKDYCREKHHVTILDEHQPLLLVKTTERWRGERPGQAIVLVPELCFMTGLTDQTLSDVDLKKEIGSITCAEPMERVTALNSFIRELTNNDQVRSEMASWNIQLNTSMIELSGHILPAEKILMLNECKRTGTQYDQRSGSFESEIFSKNLWKPVGLNRWAIICLRSSRQIVDEYCTTLRRVAQALGVHLSPPRIVPLDNDRTSTFVEACRGIPAVCELVNVIVPNKNKDRYDAIKEIFCCDNPMASQVLTTQVLQDRNTLQTVCTKVCIQMSVKLGAEAWTLNIPPKNIMIASYDCHRDSARKEFSVGAFVCSLNQSITRWYSKVSFHQNRVEMSGNFAIHLTNGLKEFRSRNGKLPDRLVIYREGVGDEQLVYMCTSELTQIKSALNSIAEPGKILLCLIMFTKRVNARFFYRTDSQSFENPPSGTVVDTVVTKEGRYDFYLISQSVRQGTINPTLYNIIEDHTGYQPIHHQQLAYKLCHLYFNWAGTITVPAPYRYAQKLAYLTGTSLHQQPNPRLSDNLFYL